MFYININAGEIFFIVTQKAEVVNGGKGIFDEKDAILQLFDLVLAFWGGKEGKNHLKFKHLLLRTIILRGKPRADLCRLLMFILCRAAKNEPRKQISASRNRKFACSRSRTSRKRGRKRCAPKAAAFGNRCIAALHREKEKNMSAFCVSPAILLPRAAGGETKTFLLEI